ncbi:hypothetical protein BMT55_00070 [Listeria newyorkensis]|uniref:Uncharacterized protein n=1 Tax=Listeria newyorkensis TaxID=1497681 RepID=A0ABX4XR56_9LIST|nr:hypothetical protein [Listeria newyorkensis]PNP94788.1 hypothetical protein BMT55_00070 [Listeria newyorkensis]
MEGDSTKKVNEHIHDSGYKWLDRRRFTFPESDTGSIGIVIDGKGFVECADIDDVMETLDNMAYIFKTKK